MIAEIGLMALILALLQGGLGIVLPSIGLYRSKPRWVEAIRPIVLTQSFLMSVAFLALFIGFIENDFSIRYVAMHSNTALPLRYKMSAIWAGHEGSLLLWLLWLSGWMSLFSCRAKDFALQARVLIVLEVISVVFIAFLLATSNPFERLIPQPLDGNDLNPLLQDIGLIIHPPLLYLGYTGLAIPFAFAIALLWSKDTNISWAKALRPWVLWTFAFLSAGITLGSFWAYYELGWGGWWFWDPVENASFIPWLLSIALIHTLMSVDKRGELQGISLLLAIATFLVTLLGVFLVRSGMISSVHMFASDPTRGVFLFMVLMGFLLVSIVLYVTRIQRFARKTVIALFSREALILLFSVFIIVSAASVLLGTLFPLVYEQMLGEKISVGFPYFNAVFIPLIVPVLLMLPVGPFLKWSKNTFGFVRQKLFITLVGASIVTVIMLYPFPNLSALLGVLVGGWVCSGTLVLLFTKCRKGKITLGGFGTLMAHAGVGVCALGIALVSHYQQERDVAMSVGQTVTLAGANVTFQAIRPIEGSNYLGHQGVFELAQTTRVDQLFPEKRVFFIQDIAMSETAIHSSWFREFYIALGQRLAGDTWSVRIYYKPCVRWIWLGGVFMALGGVAAGIARRRVYGR